MMRWLYRLAHWFFLSQAISRGPRYAAAYQARRTARQFVYRATRGPRRKRVRL